MRRQLGIVEVIASGRKNENELHVKLDDGPSGVVGVATDLPIKTAPDFPIGKRFRISLEELPALSEVESE